MGHDTLANHFKTNFGVMQHHKWSLGDLENMVPWERYIYVGMLTDWLEEEERKARDRENEMKSQMSMLNRRRM